MFRSQAEVMSEPALDPLESFTLTPLKIAGLWLAVITIANGAVEATTWHDEAGVGDGESASTTRLPAPIRVSAAISANRLERNRVS
jgi:hypothetical protein